MLDVSPVVSDIVGLDVTAPLLSQPPRTRAAMEADIVRTLAGPIAGRFADLTSGYIPTDPCEEAAQKAAAGLAALSPRDRELTLSREADAIALADDETIAGQLSWALIGHPDEAAAHLGWLRVVARNLVVSNWASVERLAAALVDHTVLSGEDALTIVKASLAGRVSVGPSPFRVTPGRCVSVTTC